MAVMGGVVLLDFIRRGMDGVRCFKRFPVTHLIMDGSYLLSVIHSSTWSCPIGLNI